MDLTLLPSKKTVAKWELGVLVIAQGNSVIELTPEQAAAVYKFIGTSMKHAVVLEGARQDWGN